LERRYKMAYLLGIDLGTSSIKALLIDSAGKEIALAQQGYSIHIPHEGYAEQSPEVWWKAAVKVISEVLAISRIRSRDIKCIGLSGQMHGMVLLDKNNNLIRPAIIWCDQRSKTQVEEVYEKIGKEQLGMLTLNSLATGFQTASLLWIKKNEPENYKNIYKVILPKDYIRLKLTGEIATDITDASSTLAFDTTNHKWCKKIINILDLDIENYPKTGHPTDIAGIVTTEASRETGLLAGTPVALGGGDQPMQAVGNGIVNPGTVSVTIGTGGQVFTPINEPAYDPLLRTHTFCNAVPGSWNIMGATLSAGLSLNWLNENVINAKNFSELSKEAERVPICCEGLLYLPYLTGERTPHMDPFARGSFFGLTLKHNRSHLVRAVMEGVTFSLRNSIDIFEALNITMDKIIASGGGAKSRLWLQIQADIFNKEVYTTNTSEQAALGAAITAGVGINLYPSIQEACQNIVQLSEAVVCPIDENVKVYKYYYDIFNELYNINKPIFPKLSSR
jgi:xylulokinase